MVWVAQTLSGKRDVLTQSHQIKAFFCHMYEQQMQSLKKEVTTTKATIEILSCKAKYGEDGLLTSFLLPIATKLKSLEIS